MTKIDPIIAVADVGRSADWYQSVFNCKRTHGGDEFAVLVNEKNEVLICLHKWGAHEHPTMKNPDLAQRNGLILYYKTDHWQQIRKNLEQMDYPVEKDIQVNSNSRQPEFSLRDPDGYYITITAYHTYEG